MGFEYSDSTKRIREAHNQEGHMGRISDPLINCEKQKLFRKRKLQERVCLLKKFEILFGEQFISIISLIGDHPKEAIYLTIEYIYRILELAPPMAQSEGEEHRRIWTFFCERGQREAERTAYNMLIWEEKGDLKNRKFSCEERKKPLNKRELKRVYEKFPSLKPKKPINKLSYSDYRKHIFGVCKTALIAYLVFGLEWEAVLNTYKPSHKKSQRIFVGELRSFTNLINVMKESIRMSFNILNP